MKRRSFLTGSLFTAAGLTAFPFASTSAASKSSEKSAQPLVDSFPVLQTPAETTMGVVWAVNQVSTGWVEVATKKDFSDARKVMCGGLKVHALEKRILSVQITGLKPATHYFYRTFTQAYDARDSYATRRIGEPVVSKIYSFTTFGKAADPSFAVINDTHEDHTSFKKLIAKIDQLNPSVMVWNGDVCNQTYSIEGQIGNVLRPSGLAYATSRPFLYAPGNHDYRGFESRKLNKILLSRRPEERDSRFAALDRNFAVRLGDMALIGLDTGEDKPDKHPVWAGLANFEPYRELQTEWLKEVLERPDIKSAPYLVAFCHIPLYDSNPNANPGDVLWGYADWQRPCSKMWSPLFKKHHLSLLVTAHQHSYRSFAATPDRPWLQLIGGGPSLTQDKHVTVIHGKVADGQLKIVVHNMVNDSIIGEFAIKPRF